MDAVEYLKTVIKMCDSMACGSCKNHKSCEEVKENPEAFVKATEKWAKEHQVNERTIKTRQSEFLKMFPYALTLFAVVDILPCNIDARKYKDDECKKFLSCEDCRRKYWTEEIE